MPSDRSLSNREALLLAARKCLLEKGYNRTTARDIASAAHVSLAAIGYHFATKEALLTEALLLAFGEWDRDLQEALRSALPARLTPAERFQITWTKIMGTFETHRALWMANFEIFAQMVAQPVARETIAGKLHLARTGLAAMFLGQDESTISDETSRTLGTFFHVLLSGLVLQWLIDPASSLTPKTLTDALRTTAQNLSAKPTTTKSKKNPTRNSRKSRK